MLENLLGSSSPKGLGYTGPGPQELIGYYETPDNPDRHTGFFGEVLATELITGDALAALIGLSVGFSSKFSSDPWLKFLLDGRILFVAKRIYRTGINWNQLNAVNAVYGNRTIAINSENFTLALLKGQNPDDSVVLVDTFDPEGSWGSEWNRLLYNVGASSQPKNSQEGGQWANYTQTQLYSGDGLAGAYCWCQDTVFNRAAYRVIRGGPALTYLIQTGAADTQSRYGWRPYLELVI